MADVFISYHEASAGTLAEKIANRLDEAGISCWCARRDMPFGGDFARSIPAQIDSCKIFLLLLNENVYKSRHIESELGLAFSRWNHEEDIQILPLEIGDFTRRDWIRYYLIHAQSDKFPDNPDEQGIQRLVGRVGKLLGKEPAPQIVKRGKCGDNVTYILENGVLMISGTGPMQNFTRRRENPWHLENKMIFHVQIEKGVTVIGKHAFHDCMKLKSVTISNSVTSIGQCAFSYCVGLTSVIIPDGVTTIENSAFSHCMRLTSVTIPNSMTTIGNCVFQDCTALTSVTIPDSVTTIKFGAFSDCTALTSITIPDSVIIIGIDAFRGCDKLTSVTIPDSVTEIGRCAFYGCDKLISVSVPSKAKIHLDAFPPTVRVMRRA